MQKHRCQWCGEDPLYVRYHDEEWGLPTYDDATLFEFLILEGAQAGLAWITVLKKREGYRAVFDQFDPNKIARFSDAKLAALKLDERIIRNRLKINSARQNARAFLSVQAEWGSFSQYLWHFVDGKPVINQVDLWLMCRPKRPCRIKSVRTLRRAALTLLARPLSMLICKRWGS